jgi:hypothetical protein
MNLGSSNPCPRFLRLALAIVSFFYLAPSNSRAMVINLTYDSSITGLTNAVQVEAAINLAAQVLDNLYTNVMTVNITFYFDPGVNLGESITFETGNPTYSQITNYLRNARTTLADSNSVASLPATDPTGGVGVWWLPRAEAKALGGVFSIATNATDGDGNVYFDSTLTYALNPTNRAVAGESDLTSVAEHEISEVLGRGFGLNYVNNGQTNGFVPYDLFRFTNNAARSFDVNANNAYFSVDKGLTPLAYFYTDVTMGDVQDWQSHTPSDSFDAFLTEGTEGYLSIADLTALDILGYSLNYHTPKLSAQHLTNGTMRLTFTNVTGLNFSILASTNISTAVTNWVNLGTPGETSIGNYQFIDAITTKARFYRAVLN